MWWTNQLKSNRALSWASPPFLPICIIYEYGAVALAGKRIWIMHEIRFIFLYHPAARYKVLVPKDPKQAAISGSRCFVIRVIYGVRFRLKKESLDNAGQRRSWGKELDDIANDKNRIRRSERPVVTIIAPVYLGVSPGRRCD